MNRLPINIIRLTYGYLDDLSLANACMINSNFSRKICNNTFWINKIIQKFSLNIDDINKYKGNNTYWGYYLFLSDKIDNDDPNLILLDSSANGRMDLVKISLSRGANLYDDAITDASFHGNIDIVKLLLNYKADIDLAFIYAVYGEQNDTIRFLLENGADIHYNFDQAIRDVTDKENFSITKLLLENGADSTGISPTGNPYIDMLLEQYTN